MGGRCHYLEEVEHLLIIDVIDDARPPGTLVRLAGDQVPAYLSVKMSPHEIGLPDLLFAAQLREHYPREVVIWGVQPASTGVGLDFSPPVAAQLDSLVDKVLGDLENWGLATAG